VSGTPTCCRAFSMNNDAVEIEIVGIIRMSHE
jgi:hypothetical protein